MRKNKKKKRPVGRPPNGNGKVKLGKTDTLIMKWLMEKFGDCIEEITVDEMYILPVIRRR